MTISLRLESPTDYHAVEELTREAFWGFSHPTCDEHYLVHLLRNIPAFVPELDYVAEIDAKLVGNVIYSRAKIIDSCFDEHEVLTFGPLSVHPAYSRQGVGTALMRHTITKAKLLGYKAILVYGHPDYYPRFGFRNAQVYGITTPDGKNYDAFMALPLYDGALDGISGTFHEDPVFHINAAQAEQYNLTFEPKNPAEMLPIEILFERLDSPAQEAFAARKITTLAWLNRFSGREMLCWEGIDEQILGVINQTLREYGLAEKLLPTSHILQLAEMEVRIPRATELRSKDGIAIYRVEAENERYILKVFDRAEDNREIANYRLLANLDVPILPLLKHTGNALLLPDVENMSAYRLGTEQDLADPQIARAIARWYKILHQKGRTYLTECMSNLSAGFVGLYDESDVITLENLDQIAIKTNTCTNQLWRELRKHFTEIRCLIDALSRTLTYNDFFWTNLVVAKDGTSAFMLDFHLLGKGCAYGDVRNVSSALKDEAVKAFQLEYGTEGISDVDRNADAVISPLVTLYFACQREHFPAWANTSIEEVHNGTLLKNLQTWLMGCHM